jgi:hypothetical protein
VIGAAALFAATVLSIETVAATHALAAFADLSRLGRRSMRLLLNRRASEWAKERALRLMSVRLMASSMKAGVRLVAVASPFALLLLLDQVHPFGARAALTSWSTRAGLLILSVGYALVRRATRDQGGGGGGEKGTGERLLERLALGNSAVLDLSFDIERWRYGPAARRITIRSPVFVVGLARAGTTILVERLHASGHFASLSYRDLPFPLAPNSWAAATRPARRHLAACERGHGDGLLHHLDSPEAIEEVFWRHHEGASYCLPEGLTPAPVSDRSRERFRDYVRLVLLRDGGARYLSKNNANLLRLPALVEACPDAILVHPFRDPLQQALSLLNQHRRACALAHEDPYRARFMTWLGHHEFGRDRRRLMAKDGPSPADDPDALEYWLKTWIASYGLLLRAPESLAGRQLFVDYDALCAEPRRFATTLGKLLALEDTPDLAPMRAPPIRTIDRPDPQLLSQARQIHAALQVRHAECFQITRRNVA